MAKIRNPVPAVPVLGIALAGLLAAGQVALLPPPVWAQVSGRVQVTEAGGRLAADLAAAVIYLEGRPRAARPTRPGRPARAEMALDARQFRPRVMVVAVGATVDFPNQDPFNHNVFSVDEPNAFDLGLFGRGQARSRRIARPGLVRVFCNIHPRMSGFVVAVENPWHTQPASDGSFEIADVPPGTYTLHVWHERAPELTREITVPDGGLAGLSFTLDASGYRWVQHKNKYGQAYGTARERY